MKVNRMVTIPGCTDHLANIYDKKMEPQRFTNFYDI